MADLLHVREDFYPRPPRGGRLDAPGFGIYDVRFLSTPSARRATRFASSVLLSGVISIHALREEGDSMLMPSAAATAYFYPRPPRGGRPTSTSWTKSGCNFYPRPPRGGRPINSPKKNRRKPFLSTPSARRATTAKRTLLPSSSNFYPRPPRGGRPSSNTQNSRTSRFLSTPSARRATLAFHVINNAFFDFYPRPPRGGRPRTTKQPLQPSNFYPRPPRGGRLDGVEVMDDVKIFLSTPSARRATGLIKSLSDGSEEISIHALREEGDH